MQIIDSIAQLGGGCRTIIELTSTIYGEVTILLTEDTDGSMRGEVRAAQRHQIPVNTERRWLKAATTLVQELEQ